MAKEKKEPQNKKNEEGSGILIPILTAALVCVGLFTAAIIGVGAWYASTADQRAIEAQQSESVAPARSIPTPSESPVQTVSAPPEDSEPQQVEDTEPEESAPEEESQSVASLPPASPSASAVPSASLSPMPSVKPSESQAPASSNTPQASAGNGEDRASRFASGQVLATSESDNGGDPVYHTENCRAAQKIATESELWYSSEQAAKNAGRRICGYCD